MKRFGPMLLVALCACGPTGERGNPVEPANEAAVSAPAAESAEVPSLAGAWTVTQINGQEPRQVWPMTVAVADDRFTLASECRRMVWRLRQDRNLVQFSPQAGQECPRVRSPAEQMIEKPIELANIAMFSEEGREVLLSGPGGSVTMRRR